MGMFAGPPKFEKKKTAELPQPEEPTVKPLEVKIIDTTDVAEVDIFVYSKRRYKIEL